MNFALIFAGGTGQRMKLESTPKQFLNVCGKEIIAYTIEHFENCKSIDGIVVVCLEDYIPFMVELKDKYKFNKILEIVPGGDSGQSSIFNGLKCISRYSHNKNDIVLIHDGVRPLIDESTLILNIDCVKKYGNCITSAKAIETIILLDDNKNVEDVIDRNRCYVGRAPQSFYFKEIFECHKKANELGLKSFIDSAMMMEFFGYRLHAVEGPTENIKITTPIDYYVFKGIVESKKALL